MLFALSDTTSPELGLCGQTLASVAQTKARYPDLYCLKNFNRVNLSKLWPDKPEHTHIKKIQNWPNKASFGLTNPNVDEP